MENNLIKKSVFIVLTALISICLFSGVAFADTTPIDIDYNSLETIGETTTSTGTNTSVNELPTAQDTIPEVTNSSTIANNTVANNIVTNNSTLPHTGSNTEIIFVVGLTILVGTAIYIYRKNKIF